MESFTQFPWSVGAAWELSPEVFRFHVTRSRSQALPAEAAAKFTLELPFCPGLSPPFSGRFPDPRGLPKPIGHCSPPAVPAPVSGCINL